MRFALVNPNWNYANSIYFGCREPHLPIEFGYAASILNRSGHEALIFDAHLGDWNSDELQTKVESFLPDCIVVSTAPTYLFWRCPPPELRTPIQTCRALRDVSEILIAVGPHASVTPTSTLRKLGADLVIRGEFENVLSEVATRYGMRRNSSAQDLYGAIETVYETDMNLLPAILWPDFMIHAHRHHHHRFDHLAGKGSGAEIESSRGCPFQCSFCARDSFRKKYRKRPIARVLEEMDHLLLQGVSYLYFIDEIFFPDDELIQALVERDVRFGIQTRIDLWSPERLDRLGDAGCVSIEAGIENIRAEGRRSLNKTDLITDDEMVRRLIRAKQTIPFVQATLLKNEIENTEFSLARQDQLLKAGIWLNDPVPIFPYPGCDEYKKQWGTPDDYAWERAHAFYLETNAEFSNIQEGSPLALPQLEIM